MWGRTRDWSSQQAVNLILSNLGGREWSTISLLYGTVYVLEILGESSFHRLLILQLRSFIKYIIIL